MEENNLNTPELEVEDIQAKEAEYNEQVGIRRQKLAELKAEGKDPFDVYKVNRTHTSEEVVNGFEEGGEIPVTVAGRLMSKRIQGKAGFCDLHDRYGKIQVYIRLDAVGEESFKMLKHSI